MTERRLYVKLGEGASMPVRSSKNAVGYDLASAENVMIPAHGRDQVSTELVVVIPPDCYGRVASRSSLAFRHGIEVGAGVIDPDYRGILRVVLFNHSDQDYIINVGDRIAQLILERVETPPVVVMSKLDDTERGVGGFGSTGK